MQACKLTFTGYRLMPMGSYPRVADRKGVVDLFGPVNKLFCTSYDRAQCIFLACLKAWALWTSACQHVLIVQTLWRFISCFWAFGPYQNAL